VVAGLEFEPRHVRDAFPRFDLLGIKGFVVRFAGLQLVAGRLFGIARWRVGVERLRGKRTGRAPLTRIIRKPSRP
jgi:hypothetical protein